MIARVTLSKFGTSFATRGRGRELREEALAHLGDSDSLVIDLSGVEHVSYSFADEFLAKLCAEVAVPVELQGAGPTVKRTVDDAVRRRAAVPASR